MIVYSVTVHVKEGFEKDFLLATVKNHKNTRKEKGNVRFDILQSSENPQLFMLYEVYRSEDAVTAHKNTKHYKIWRSTVEPWMAKKRTGIKFTPLYPTEENNW